MNKLQLLLTFFFFSSVGLVAQTTQDEYQYASGGYVKAEELGLGSKQGYSIISYKGFIDSYYFDQWNSQYSVKLLIRDNNPDDSIAAIILEKGNSSYCIPHPNSSRSLMNQSLTDFPEFWNTHNEAILFHLLQTSVWRDWMIKHLDGKVILNADFGIGNNWEQEVPDYAKHWDEFDFKISGRQQSYNALAKFPLLQCGEDAKVMVKFTISESGVVTSSKVVNNTYFKSYNGDLEGTDTTSECLKTYSEKLIKQFTLLPSQDETKGYVLFRFIK